MEATIYNQKGKSAGSIKLDEKVFDLPWNADLVHQVVVSMQANARTPVAHTKDRSEVSGGGKKPWRQKGTGRARHGSNRSPIWIGGGVTHGPRNEKSYDKKINKKMRVKALYTVLSEKLRQGEIMFIDTFDMPEIKTASAKAVLISLSTVKGFEELSAKRRNAAYITIDPKNENAIKSFQNFSNIDVEDISRMNPVVLMSHKYIIISAPEESLKVISARAGKATKSPIKATEVKEKVQK